MDFYVVMTRPGARVARRKQKKARIGFGHRVRKEDTMGWFKGRFDGIILVSRGLRSNASTADQFCYCRNESCSYVIIHASLFCRSENSLVLCCITLPYCLRPLVYCIFPSRSSRISIWTGDQKMPAYHGHPPDLSELNHLIKRAPL